MKKMVQSMVMNRKGFASTILLLGIAVAIGLGLSAYAIRKVEEINIENINKFGASSVVQAQSFSLNGSGVSATASSIVLTSFKLSDASTTITMANFSDGIGYGTIEPGAPKEEQISFTGVTQNADGTATLTGVTRGLNFVSPFIAVTSLQKSHAGGTRFSLSNTSAFYSQFLSRNATATITAVQTFASSAIPTQDSYLAPTLSAQFAPKGYVDAVSFAGAPNGSTVQKGIYQEASTTNVGNGTVIGSTGADLIVPNKYFNVTSSATTTVPVTNSSGKLSQGFTDYSLDINYTGTSTFNNVNVSGTTTANGIANFNATTSFAQIPTTTSTSPTTATQLATKGYVDQFGSTVASSSVGSTATGAQTTSSTMSFTLTATSSVIYFVDGVIGANTCNSAGGCTLTIDIDGGNSTSKAFTPGSTIPFIPTSFFFKTSALSNTSHILKVTVTSGNAANNITYSGTAWVYTNK